VIGICSASFGCWRCCLRIGPVKVTIIDPRRLLVGGELGQADGRITRTRLLTTALASVADHSAGGAGALGL
jgi:hypothetical protein